MSELTNLTDRISHLRDRKQGSRILSNQPPPKTPKKSSTKRKTERTLATDYFMFFVYALLSISILIQIGIIVSLDI
jgi:hypothetical protein